MKTYEEIADTVIKATKKFKEGLEQEVHLVGPIVEQPERVTLHELIEHFAKSIIDAEFAEGKLKIMENASDVLKVIKELV